MNLSIDIRTTKEQDALMEELAKRLHSYPLAVMYKALEDPAAKEQMGSIITAVLRHCFNIYRTRPAPAKIDWRQSGPAKGGEQLGQKI